MKGTLSKSAEKLHSDKTGFHNVSSAARNVKVSEWPLILTIDPKLSRLGASRSKLRTRVTFSDSRLWSFQHFFQLGAATALPAERADRMEVVTFAAEDTTGETLRANRQIYREHGKPARLLPLVFPELKGVFVMEGHAR